MAAATRGLCSGRPEPIGVSESLWRKPRRWWRRTSCRWRRNVNQRWSARTLPPGCRRPSRTCGHWDLVSLSVHALHVRNVVTVLQRPLCACGAVGARSRPAEQPDSRAYGGSGGRISSCCAHCGAPSSSKHRPDSGSADRGIGRRLLRRCSDLLQSPLTAHRIVDFELVEVFPVTGEHHHVRTGGQRRASRQKQSGRDRKEPPFAHLRSPISSTEAPAGP
jgi:hypothetical protein